MARPSPRRHEIVGHTADIGLTATAPDLPSLFEEAALALAEVSADVDPRAGGPVHRGAREGDAIELEAEDQGALADARLDRAKRPRAGPRPAPRRDRGAPSRACLRPRGLAPRRRRPVRPLRRRRGARRAGAAG